MDVAVEQPGREGASGQIDGRVAIARARCTDMDDPAGVDHHVRRSGIVTRPVEEQTAVEQRSDHELTVPAGPSRSPPATRHPPGSLFIPAPRQVL